MFLPFKIFYYYFIWYNIFVRKCIYISTNVRKVFLWYYERFKGRSLRKFLTFVKVYYYERYIYYLIISKKKSKLNSQIILLNVVNLQIIQFVLTVYVSVLLGLGQYFRHN